MPRKAKKAGFGQNGWILGGKLRVNPGRQNEKWLQNKRRFLKLVQESHGW